MTRTRTVEAFAKANGVKPALLSANSEGACPNCNCNGAGVTYTDLAMMAGVATSRPLERTWEMRKHPRPAVTTKEFT